MNLWTLTKKKMKISNWFKKSQLNLYSKEEPKEIDAKIRLIVYTNGEKYMNVEDFTDMLRSYMDSYENSNNKAIVAVIIKSLETAK